MTISIDWPSKVISVAQSDLALVSGVVYNLDVDAFRLALRALEDDAVGMASLPTHSHNTTLTLAGVAYVRSVEIINGYTVSFEDTGTPYAVQYTNANNNLDDVVNMVANVSTRSANSAGLQVVTSGGGSVPTANEIADAVWDETSSDHETTGTTGKLLKDAQRDAANAMAASS